MANTPSQSPTPHPDMHQFPEEVLCPSCGKFVGAYTRCPYCGSEHKLRISIRFFRIFSLVVGIGGVFLIWLAARGINAPLIKIKDIKPMHSFAYVRIEGESDRTRTYDDGGVSFYINDGTGSINVRAYSDIGKEIAQMGLLPGPGDKVSAEGTLTFREDRVWMIVNIPEKISVVRVIAPLIQISSLGPETVGKKARVEGKIVSVREFGKGSSYTLSDGSSTIDVVLWSSNLPFFSGKEELLKVGKSVSVQGKVGEYRGKLQIGLDSPNDLEEARNDIAIAPEAVQTMEIGEIGKTLMNKRVGIIGKVTGVREMSKGRVLTVADPTGSIDVVIWSSIQQQIQDADNLIREGNILKVRGSVGEYRDSLQIVPGSAGDIVVAEVSER